MPCHATFKSSPMQPSFELATTKLASPGLTATAGSFCSCSPPSSPPGVGVVASLAHATITGSLPPSWRTYVAWSVTLMSATAAEEITRGTAVRTASARRNRFIPLPSLMV
jgi:hypothetical protein